MLYEVLAQYIQDVPLDRIQWCIQEDRRKKDKRIFRVVEWKRNIGKSGLPSPVIGLGNEPDAPLPNLSEARKEAVDRYNHELALSRPEQRLSDKEREVLRDQKRIDRAIKRHEEEVGAARSANVFASMFTPVAPVDVKGATARQYRTSNQEPVNHGKKKRDLREDLPVD